MSTYWPGVAYHSASAHSHMGPLYAHPSFPSPEPSAYVQNDGYREDFSLPPPFPQPHHYTYSPSHSPPGGIQGPPSMPSETGYMDPNSGHPGPFRHSLPFTQPPSQVSIPQVPGGGYHGSWNSFEDNSHGLSKGAPSYPLAGPAIAPYQAVTSPDEHPYPPTQIVRRDPIGSTPGHAGDTSQGVYGAGNIVYGGEYATGGHSSEPTGDVQPLTFPIFLVKRKVDSTLLKIFSGLVHDDATHWALQVNGMQYHIIPSKDGTIEMSHQHIEPIVEPEKIGRTACNHIEIVQIFEELLQSTAQLKYNVFSHNCRNAVLSLWFNIRYTWPSLNRLEALLEDGNITFESLAFLEHRLRRRLFEDSKRFYENILRWQGGKGLLVQIGLPDFQRLCQQLLDNMVPPNALS